MSTDSPTADADSVTSGGSEPPAAPATDDFAHEVRQYLRIRDELERLKIAQRERTKHLKTLSVSILAKMQAQKLETVSLARGRQGHLIHESVTKPVALSKKCLAGMLHAYFKDDAEKAAQLATYLVEERAKKTTNRLVFRKPDEVA